MAHIFSVIFFSALLVGGIGVIIAMLREQESLILGALGLEPRSTLTALPPRARRTVPRRIVRPAMPVPRALSAAA